MYKVDFPDTNHAPVDVPEGPVLSEVLDATNSPVLFGCRTGICGTCIVELDGDVPAADEDEQEILDIYAPENKKVRLACQVRVCGNIRLRSVV